LTPSHFPEARDYCNILVGMKRIPVVCLLFITCLRVLSSSDFSPGRYFRFDHLVPEFRGKTAAAITSVFQDKEGFLWFGTNMGLARYDGYHFVFFSPKSGPDAFSSSVVVFPVIEDSAGDIWIGTDGEGLLEFDKNQETFRQYRHSPSDPKSLSGDIVLSIQEDRQGDLWVGTRLTGLNRFDKSAGTFSRFPLNPAAETVWDLLVDRRGFLWIGTQEEGLFKLDPDKGEIVNYRFILENPRSLGSNTVWTIFEDRQGTIWIGTKGGGLNQYNPEGDDFVRFYGDRDHARDLASNTITAITEDQAGRLWMGTSSNGLRIWDRKIGEYIVYRHDPQDPESLSDDNVTFIHQDTSGMMWAGTTRGGVNKSVADQAKFHHFKNNPNNSMSLSHNDVLSLWMSRSGSLWVGLKNGLDRVDEKSGVTARFLSEPSNSNSLGDNCVQAIVEDREGKIWFGTDAGGLDCLDPRTGVFTHYRNDPKNSSSLSNNRVYALWPEKGDPNILWIGTHHGLNRFDIRLRQFTDFLHEPADLSSLSGNIVTAIHEDRSGFLWVGTRSGLNRMERATGKCERYISDIKNPPGKSINDNIINCIHEDGRGFLWIGTNSGLNRLDRRKNEWRYYDSKEGLPGGVVCGVLEDESGFLWVSTNRGLAKFDLQSEVFVNYGIHDGIQGDQFNPRACFKEPRGRMFFGGINGYNAFHPEAIKKNPFIPPIAWTALTRNGQEVKIGNPFSRPRSLKLSSRFDVYAFEFAALCFDTPSLNQFAYKLEPRDQEWILLGPANTVTVSRIKPGEYRLHVKGSNPDGVWNENGFEIGLQLVPPFWRTTWFAVLALLFVASGVATVVRMWLKLKSAFMVAGDRADSLIDSYGLTAREQEILRLILQGASNKDIERKLFISASTVRNHVYNIYQKLGVRNRLELINRIGQDARTKA